MKKYFVFIIISIGVLFFLARFANAQTQHVSDNFDSYSIGSYLNSGLGQWESIGNDGWSIVPDESNTFPYSVSATSTSAVSSYELNPTGVTPASGDTITGWIYVSADNTGTASSSIANWGFSRYPSGSGTLICFMHSADPTKFFVANRSSCSGGTVYDAFVGNVNLNKGEWHKVSLIFKGQTDLEYNIEINNVVYNQTRDLGGTNPLRALRIFLNDGTDYGTFFDGFGSISGQGSLSGFNIIYPVYPEVTGSQSFTAQVSFNPTTSEFEALRENYGDLFQIHSIFESQEENIGIEEVYKSSVFNINNLNLDQDNIFEFNVTANNTGHYFYRAEMRAYPQEKEQGFWGWFWDTFRIANQNEYEDRSRSLPLVFFDTTQFFVATTTTDYFEPVGSEYCDQWNFPVNSMCKVMFNFFSASTELFIDKFYYVRDGIITKAPWGYGFRLYNIVTGNVTEEPANLVLTFPSNLRSATGIDNLTLDLDVWNSLSTAVSYIDNANVENIDGSPLDRFMEYWTFIWNVILGLALFNLTFRAWQRGDFDDFIPLESEYKAYRKKQFSTIRDRSKYGKFKDRFQD